MDDMSIFPQARRPATAKSALLPLLGWKVNCPQAECCPAPHPASPPLKRPTPAAKTEGITQGAMARGEGMHVAASASVCSSLRVNKTCKSLLRSVKLRIANGTGSLKAATADALRTRQVLPSRCIRHSEERYVGHPASL